MGRAVNHQTVITINNEWETPPDVLAEAMKKYDIHPFLDVCATSKNSKCIAHFTKDYDALTRSWDSDFFMNPPYSEINTWMEKAYKQHKKNNVNALILVFTKTSTKWWHEYVEGKAEVHFQKGRIRFLLNNIEPRNCKHCKRRSTENSQYCPICKRKIQKSSPTYDSCWVIYRKER